MKRSVDRLQIISIIFLALYIFIIIFISIQMPFFYKFYSQQTDQPGVEYELLWKEPKMEWIVYFFQFLGAYYMQPYIFSLRENLLLPSQKRFKKVSKISIWIVFFTFVGFSFIVYRCLGDNYTQELIILRKPYLPSNHLIEIFYKGILFIYLIVN